MHECARAGACACVSVCSRSGGHSQSSTDSGIGNNAGQGEGGAGGRWPLRPRQAAAQPALCKQSLPSNRSGSSSGGSRLPSPTLPHQAGRQTGGRGSHLDGGPGRGDVGLRVAHPEGQLLHDALPQAARHRHAQQVPNLGLQQAAAAAAGRARGGTQAGAEHQNGVRRKRPPAGCGCEEAKRRLPPTRPTRLCHLLLPLCPPVPPCAPLCPPVPPPPPPTHPAAPATRGTTRTASPRCQTQRAARPG